LSFDAVDHLLALDPGRRGIAAFFQAGAARRAATALSGSRRVVITTGFIVEPKMAETDGPPGAAVLGRALRRLGADVTYVTDAESVPVMAAALRALGEPPDIHAYGDGPGAAEDVLAGARPTHLVAIERPARSRSGDYLNMRGHSVAEWNRPIDELFVAVVGRDGATSRSKRAWPDRGRRGSVLSDGATSRSKRGWPDRGRRGSVGRPVTIGVGDGGNEIGMGNVRARLVRQGALMARIAATVTVDHLVVAGVSNWGAYGIVAHLGQLAGQPLLHTPAQERELVAACVEAGASDGVTRRREPTVDALPLDVHASIVALLGVSWGP
jgi:D-glutamate cyclase